MAQFEDAVVGWGIYRDRSGQVSLQQLNQAIRAQGREPVSPRMYKHYEKLMRLGYDEYVSINRLDIRHANDSIFDLSDRSRYPDQSLVSPGRLILPTGGARQEFSGQVISVSEGFATLRVPAVEQARRAARASKWNKGVLVFEQVGIDRAVQVVEAIERGPQLDLLLEFRSLLETDLVLPAVSVDVVASRLRINLGPEPSLFQVVQVTHLAFDLLESSRGFVELALQAERGDDSRLPTPRIRHLEVTNPWELVLLGAAPVAYAVAKLLDSIGSIMQRTVETVRAGQDIRYRPDQERREAERHAAEMERHQAEMERHRAEMDAKHYDSIKQQIPVGELLRSIRGGEPGDEDESSPGPSPEVQPRLEALKNQAVEAGGEMLQTSSSVVFEPEEEQGGAA